MTPLIWLVSLSVGSAVAASWLVDRSLTGEIMLGMVAPLAAVCASWIALERAYRLNPLSVMRVTLRLGVAKAMFLVAFMIAVIQGLEIRPTPFVVSFTAYFIGLYMAEAVLLRRLFGRPVARG